MAYKQVFLGLDVGAKRIGVATADSIARIAQPIATIEVGQNEVGQLQSYIHDLGVTDVVIGHPRNQSGLVTAQTVAVQHFIASALTDTETYKLHWQDESVTSVIAEERLKARKKPYTKLDIDAEAAAIILQDYLEASWTA
ncbi:MAG TPA: Holliday junction resolvase RuvX [Magnetospirillaceae bacterium]|nr:Holliday junction resolvase RuvX [Magnetospirillaceae bacterium]